MTVEPQRLRYLRSVAFELEAQASRVRDLIGDSHWLSDGHHKEYLLLSTLNRHLPAGMIASRGFVVNPHDPNQRSKEQDILVLDVIKEAPIFNQGNLVVAFPRQVVASISVKTTISKDAVVDSICGLASVRNLFSHSDRDATVWYGAYFYSSGEICENNHDLLYDWVVAGITAANNPAHPNLCINLLACRSSLVCKTSESYRDGYSRGCYINGFYCQDLETAFFLGHLLDVIAIRRGALEGELLSSLDTSPCHPFNEPRRDII